MASSPYILVVDDEEGTRTAIRAALEAAGYAVKSAANGQEALNVLLAEPENPSLVVLDLQMPVMDGYEFLSKLRERAGMGAVPVIVVTGCAYDGRLADAVGYMRKPIRLEQIVSAARTWSSSRAASG